jgi:hypothetical protein
MVKRGGVFINETIPYKSVAWVANKLYKEDHTVVPIKNIITKKIEYRRLVDKKWNRIYVESSLQTYM